MIESISFDERTHKYTAIIDGKKRYPASVSEVCRGSYGYISPAAEAAMKRGREVHDDIATRLLSGEEPKKIINKFARFTENLYTVHVEHPVCALFGKLLVAGTPDLIAETRLGDWVVIDWKTGTTNSIHYTWQVAMYALMVGAKRAMIVFTDKKSIKPVLVDMQKNAISALCKKYLMEMNTNIKETAIEKEGEL